MSQKSKLITRFLSVPADFTWDELVAVLRFYDYSEISTGKTAGSRKRFADGQGNIILLHKPHPAKIVKKYAVRQVIDNLKEKRKSDKMSDVLQYKGYYADIHFSAEDEVFYGQLIGINDLVNFEAGSVKELKKAFTEAVEDYLATCKKLRKIPDKAYKGSFNVRVSPELHRQAAVFAAIKKVTLNDFVRSAIDTAISNEKMETN